MKSRRIAVDLAAIEATFFPPAPIWNQNVFTSDTAL